jgi:hypothetical protein
MSTLIRQRARTLALIALAAGLSTTSIGCKISGGQVGGSVGVGTNGRPTGSIGGTITFMRSMNNEQEVVDEDTGNVYYDDGTLDYANVQASEGTSLSGVVESTEYLYGGGGGGCGGDGGSRIREYQEIQPDQQPCY